MISQTLAGLTLRSLVLDHCQSQVEAWEGWGHQHLWSFVRDTPFLFSHGAESYARDRTAAGQLIHLSSDPGVTSSDTSPLAAGEGGCKSLLCGSARHLEAVLRNEGKGCHFLPGSFSGVSTMRHPCSPEWVLCILQHLLPTPTFTGPLCFYGVTKRRHMCAGSRILIVLCSSQDSLYISRHRV